MDVRTAEEAQAYGRDLLVGERVRLRRLEESDLPLLEAWWSDPEWQQLQSKTVRPRPEGSQTEVFRRWAANDSPAGAGFCVVEAGSGELLGQTTLWGAALPERAATFAILLGPHAVGHGYGVDATRTMVRYGFLAMGLHRIELSAWSFNDRALGAYRRAGFVEEGRRRDAVFLNGGFADEVLMSVLRSEWEESSPWDG